MWGFIAFTLVAVVIWLYASSIHKVPFVSGISVRNVVRGYGLISFAMFVFALLCLLGTPNVLKIGVLFGNVIMLGGILSLIFGVFGRKMDILLPVFLFFSVCLVGLRLLVYPEQAYLRGNTLVFNETYFMLLMFAIVLGAFWLVTTVKFVWTATSLVRSSKIKVVGVLSAILVPVSFLAMLGLRNPMLSLLSAAFLGLAHFGLMFVNSKVRQEIANSYQTVPMNATSQATVG